MAQLSPYRLSKARDVYNYFNVFNAISWNLLVGIIITLFALRLGASSTYIGLMSATFYIALFLLPLGKVLARRFSIISIFAFTWSARSLCMILAVAAPFVDYAGYRKTALLLIMLGVLLFHLFRGIGMIGNNPVLSQLATGPDRGSYMTQIQIINSAIGMFGSFLIAMILGMEPPIFIFSILLSIGVITGVISGNVIKKVPEPPREEEGKGMNLAGIFKEAMTQDSLRHFMFILFLVVLVSGVTRTFVVVYAREVFAHNDGLISLYSVFGGLGFLMAGLIVKFLVDRLGAKPLFLVCVIIGLICLIPIIFLPSSAVENMTGAILFMVFLFFMLNFGFLGSEGIAQTYFIALIPSEKMLDMGILYFFIFGVAGAVGSFLSGLLLDLLMLIGVSPFISFKILFGIMIILAVIALAMRNKMKALDSLPLRDALEVIFSVRDLRAISLLGKLNKAQDHKEEELLLEAMHDTPSNLIVDGLLDRTRSPKLATRMESIRALEKLKTLNKKAEQVLIKDITDNPFTTAYISARILGNNNCTTAIPMLRELAVSDDYMLAGESIIALARMKDEEFRREIENIILETKNPRLQIMCAEALGIYHKAESITVLLDILRAENPPPYLMDEIVLIISTIIDTQKTFYKILVRYMADNTLAATLANDEAEATLEFVNNTLGKKKFKINSAMINPFIKNFHEAVLKYVKENNGGELSRWILDLPEESLRNYDAREKSIIKSVLSEAVVDTDLNGYDCLRLLIINWAAQQLRIWAAMIK
ncbi:MAG: MFS transporter [Treponema sp.]|nr:MFS transporter [Treponema sp.]MCL2250757.1 MFS transporter [Treponema sp.]